MEKTSVARWIAFLAVIARALTACGEGIAQHADLGMLLAAVGDCVRRARVCDVAFLLAFAFRWVR